MVRKLKAKGVPKSEIITITGHRQEQRVEAYDSGNEDEQRQLSNIIDGKEIHLNQTANRLPLQPLIQSTAAVSSGHVYNFHNCNVVIKGSRVGAAVRALAFHQCVPGSIPGPGVICGLSLLVLYFAPRGFSLGTPVFPSPLQKLTFDLMHLICLIYLI